MCIVTEASIAWMFQFSAHVSLMMKFKEGHLDHEDQIRTAGYRPMSSLFYRDNSVGRYYKFYATICIVKSIAILDTITILDCAYH